ncbi:MAG: DUF72 domain-containing protein [Thermofilaceae archaeon]
MLYVGCCGWCIGRAKYYTVFNTVELQDTFYNPPDPEKLLKLASEAPQGFVFTMKAWQAITHSLDSPTWKRARMKPDTSLADKYGLLRPTKEVFKAWDLVVDAAKALGAKVVVVQTPPSFSYSEENYRNAFEFFSTAETSYFLIGWEPRGTWIQHWDKVVELVSSFKKVIHIVDPFRAHLAMVKETVYFRLHGVGSGEVNYRYKYKSDDLVKLSGIVNEHLRADREVYVMFNNVHMAQDAQRFKQMYTG